MTLLAPIETIISILAVIKEDASLAQRLTPESHVIDEAQLDSLDLIKFMLEVETRFSFEFDFETLDFSSFQSISAFAQYIMELQKKHQETMAA
jgi:acyl carrier protein